MGEPVGDAYIGPIKHSNAQCKQDKCDCWCQACERHNWRHAHTPKPVSLGPNATPDDVRAFKAWWANEIQTVYELIFSTDEAYYTVGHFASKEDAEKVAAIGNARVEQRDRDQHLGLNVKERPVLTGSDWTVEQIKEVLEEQGPDFGDWFLPEMEEEE